MLARFTESALLCFATQLNFRLDGATFVATIRKPFDVFADELISRSSRSGWTAIELSLSGIRVLGGRIAAIPR